MIGPKVAHRDRCATFVCRPFGNSLPLGGICVPPNLARV